MYSNFFFLTGLSFLLVHEMDAVRCREWTIFPFLSKLKEETGYAVFTAVHIPLFYLLFRGFATGQIFNPGVKIALDVFFIIHIVLHGIFHRHPDNRFASRFSWVIILGAGVSGLLDILTLVYIK